MSFKSIQKHRAIFALVSTPMLLAQQNFLAAPFVADGLVRALANWHGWLSCLVFAPLAGVTFLYTRQATQDHRNASPPIAEKPSPPLEPSKNHTEGWRKTEATDVTVPILNQYRLRESK